MNKKYKFTGETIQHEGITLHRIQALRSFGNVKEGDSCWIGENAQLYRHAHVMEDAETSSDILPEELKK